MNETMGQIIRRLRKERDLTQEELAELLNVSNQAVSKWERDESMPDISQVVPLANVFGVTTDVLFGMDGTDGSEEIEEFIRKTEIKICNPPEDENHLSFKKECCQDVLEMLKLHPTSYKLLAYSLGHIVCLLNDSLYNTYDKKLSDTETEYWQNECIRQANVIFSHCTEAEYLNSAAHWIAHLYESLKDFGKAEEYAQKLPEFSYTDRGSELAYIYTHTGRQEEAILQRGENICCALNYLEKQLVMLGHVYGSQEKHEEAYACYRMYPELYRKLIIKNDDAPFSFLRTHEYCAMECMNLNRPEEAMDWLEELIRYEEFTARNHNVVVKSKHPILGGCEFRYWAEHYDRTDTILPVLAWKIFDPIRETDRFRAIVKAAEKFEKSE